MLKIGVLTVLFGLGAVAWAASDVEENIAERIAPMGKSCMSGQDCAAAPVQEVASGGQQSPEDIYNARCNACHGTGMMESPKLGDAAAWEGRIAKGVEVLYDHAINGFNMMPAKGGCAGCSDEEIQQAVDFMVSKAQ